LGFVSAVFLFHPGELVLLSQVVAMRKSVLLYIMALEVKVLDVFLIGRRDFSEIIFVCATGD
jgi:hypothetical protein